MPAEHMFWGSASYGDRDRTRVPLKSYRCKSHLVKTADGITSATGHKCKKVIDHEGDHGCICGKAWEPVAGRPV